MKQLGSLCLGILLSLVSLIFLLSNISVSSFSFYRYNGFNIGAFLLILLVIAFIVFLVKTNIGTGLIFLLLGISFIVTLLMSINFTFKRISVLMLVLILGCLAIGVSLIIKGVFGLKTKNWWNFWFSFVFVKFCR